MPELPEVEVVRRGLAVALPGRTLLTVTTDPRPRFASASAAAGTRVLDVRRRGKFLLVGLAERPGGPVTAELLLHLGMSGVLSYGRVRPGQRHTRLAATLDDGQVLTLVDPRGFGRAQLAPAGEHERSGALRGLGPEPDDPAFTDAAFAAALGRTRLAVKAALLGQRIVAGPGNIYVDEACWRARVHPATPASLLTAEQAVRLRAAVTGALADGLTHGGTTLCDYRALDGSSGSHQHHLDCYGRAGRPCRRCGTDLARTRVAGRGTTFCPTCQPPA